MTESANAVARTAAGAPLDGIRVVDLSRVLAGPWCTMTLADLGALVFKVENPVGGDDTRMWHPPSVGGESAYYLSANRSKKSIAVDMATPGGQSIIRKLASMSDILVENFRLGALERFGLDYSTLHKLNPRLIYCSISGYGRNSPLAERAGYDFVAQAEGGLMSITGEADGEPMKVGVAIVDLVSGMNAAQAILAALIARQRTGMGQHIDIALLDSQVAMLANVASSCLVTGKRPIRYGNAHATVVPYQVFDVKNGAIVVAVGNDRQFATLCTEVIARPDLYADERFRTNAARVKHRAELLPILAHELRRHDRAYWLSRLAQFGLPGGAIRHVDEVLVAPEVLARDMVKTVAHPTAGTVSLVGSPLKLSHTPVREPVAPPLLGQHTSEVLKSMLNYSDSEIERLRAEGSVA